MLFIAWSAVGMKKGQSNSTVGMKKGQSDIYIRMPRRAYHKNEPSYGPLRLRAHGDVIHALH